MSNNIVISYLLQKYLEDEFPTLICSVVYIYYFSSKTQLAGILPILGFIIPSFSSILSCIQGEDNVSQGYLGGRAPYQSSQSQQLRLLYEFCDMDLALSIHTVKNYLASCIRIIMTNSVYIILILPCNFPGTSHAPPPAIAANIVANGRFLQHNFDIFG